MALSDLTSEELAFCCGSTKWVNAMLDRNPFGTLDEAISAGDECWKLLGASDWLEAMSHHPRIGEKTTGAAAKEQAAAQSADESFRQQLADVNAEYESRFGYIYIVCAAGRSAGELIAAARGRLAHDPDTELKVAAEELRKIMHLRLEKVFTDEHD